MVNRRGRWVPAVVLLAMVALGSGVFLSLRKDGKPGDAAVASPRLQAPHRDERISRQDAEKAFLLAMKARGTDFQQAFLDWAKVAGEDDPNYLKYLHWARDQYSPDYAKYFDFAEALPNGRYKDMCRSEAVQLAARKDPELAIKLFDRYPPGTNRTDTIRSMLSLMPPEVTTRWLRQSAGDDMLAMAVTTSAVSKYAMGGDLAPLFVQKLLDSRLPEKDKATALGWLLREGTPEQRMDFSKSIFLSGTSPELEKDAFTRALRLDPNAALEMLTTRLGQANPPPDPDVSRYLLAAAQKMSEGDPLKGLTWVVQLDEDLKAKALENYPIFQADGSVSEAMKTALRQAGLTDDWIASREASWEEVRQREAVYAAEDKANEAMRGAARQRGQDVFDKAGADHGYHNLQQQLAGVADPLERSLVTSGWTTSLVNESPEEAGRIFLENPELLKTADVTYLLRQMAQKSSPAAIQWAARIPDPRQQAEMVRYATTNWVTRNEAAAAEGVKALPASAGRDYAYQAMAQWSAAKDPGKSQEWIAGIKDPVIRAAAARPAQ